MSRSLLLILLGLGGIVMDDASNALFAQDAYPRVYGPTGRPYGPTQAHYQYERQYGRPWPGGPAPYDPNTGAQGRVHGGGWGGYPAYGGYYGDNLPYGGFGYNVQARGIPFGFGLPGYNGYAGYQNQFGWGPIQQYQVGPQPLLRQFGPPPVFSWQQPDAFQQPQFQRPQPRQPAVPGVGPAPAEVVEARPVGIPEPVMARPHAFMPAEPSNAAQRQRSLHLQGQGDIWFRQQNFLQAYSRYKQAAGAASDLPAPRFRMAYALMALQRYELAVPELQRGIQLDPQYPLTGESPQQIYGEENQLAAAALPQAVAAWVRQDIRSPDRLFLLGALLTISGDQARARILLQTAAEFGGPAEHVIAFLNVGQQPVAKAPQNVPDDDRPPVPEAVEKMLKENQNWLPAKPLAARQAPPFKPETSPRGQTPKPEEPKIEAVAKLVDPNPALVEAVDPAAPKKPYPLAPGYVTIPKKGSAPEPATPAEPSEIQPAAGEATPDSESGPIIPIPGSAN